MKVYKPTYKDKKTGKVKKCQHWYLTFIDNKQIRRRLPAFSNKRATEKTAEKIQELLSSGGILSPELQRWVENLPKKMRENLIKFGLIDSRKLSENLGKPLVEHLKDFCQGLLADACKASYVKQTENGIGFILNGCKFNVWSDIDGNKVKMFLAKGRGLDGYGQRTYNSYMRGFKEFCTWLIREGRVVGSNPMDGHNLIKQTEFRKKRRALSLDEITRLLQATETAPRRFNMTGFERSLVYRLALQTGARMGEIKSLRKVAFNFEVRPCTVRVEASDCKGKKSDNLILMDDTAKAIEKFLSNKKPQDKAFTLPHKANYTKMLREDLIEAEIPYRDESGRDADAHALRHTFISNLALAGVHPAVAQKLARHSSIELTMKFYTHVLHESEVAAIDALKNLSYTCQKCAQRRTIMDNRGQKNLDNDSKTALSA